MKSRALMIGARERSAISELIEKAERRVTPLADMARAAEQKKRTGNAFNAMNEASTIDLPIGYAVTYTHEEQPGAMCRHMSVSVDGAPGTGPNPHAVESIMAEFGFKNPLQQAFTYLDTLRDGRLVINVIEPLDGNMESLRK